MGLEKILNNFKSKKILVIGDAIIDSYLWGEINRMSPEAPVPVVDVKVNQNDNRLGGAANVALNLKELGAKAILCTVIGNDSKGILFEKLMNDSVNILKAKEMVHKWNKKRIKLGLKPFK